jgi:hypothetical protein
MTRFTAENEYRTKHVDFLSKISKLCVGNGSAYWDRMAADLLHPLTAPTAHQIAEVDAGVAKIVKRRASDVL